MPYRQEVWEGPLPKVPGELSQPPVPYLLHLLEGMTMEESYRAILEEGKTLLSMYGVLDRSRVDDEFALMDEFRKHLIAFHRSRGPEVSKRTLDALQSSRETGSRRPRRSEVARAQGGVTGGDSTRLRRWWWTYWIWPLEDASLFSIE